jgi:hypothetical protein
MYICVRTEAPIFHDDIMEVDPSMPSGFDLLEHLDTALFERNPLLEDATTWEVCVYVCVCMRMYVLNG